MGLWKIASPYRTNPVETHSNASSQLRSSQTFAIATAEDVKQREIATTSRIHCKVTKIFLYEQ